MMKYNVVNLSRTLLLCVVLSACDRTPTTNTPTALAALLAMSPVELAKVDIARMNLLCAQGLTGEGEDLDIILDRLDAWAERVQSETERHRYRFDRNPAEFDGSEGFFKLLMLGVVLAEDYGVRYHPGLRSGPGVSIAKDGFFADARPVFLSGLLGEDRYVGQMHNRRHVRAYHAYILVTDRNGYRFFFRGGPGPGGVIRVDQDVYLSGAVDYDDKGEHRRMRVYEDCDSCDRWYHALNASGEAINGAQIPYDPLTTNCNWAVANMLKDAGLWNVSIRDLTIPPYFAPGWNHPWPERPEPND